MRCNNSELLSKINSPKLTKQTEATFTIIKDLETCRRISANKAYNEPEGTYYKLVVPENRFECLGEGCVNTGTFFRNSAGELMYRGQFDAREISAGVLTFYVAVAGSDLPATINVTLSSDSNFANADRYTVTVYEDVLLNGFAPVVVDLSNDGTQVGDGWVPDASGVYFKVESTVNFGYSSFAFFESIEDFATTETVKVGCLSSAGNTFDLSLIESACSKASYNDQMTGITYNLTGRTVTPNYRALNPMAQKGKAATGFEIVTKEFTVGENGMVQLADLYQDECRFVSVQRKGVCSDLDSMLTQLTIPSYNIELEDDQFQVLPGPRGTSYVRFSNRLENAEVLISYPRVAEVEETVINADGVNGVRTSMAIEICLSDRVKEVHVFNNVFVTSFPGQISESDTEFSFTINIQPDKGGDYFHIYRISE